MNCRAASGQDSSLIDRSGEVHIVSFTMIFIADGWSRLWFVVGHIRETVESLKSTRKFRRRAAEIMVPTRRAGFDTGIDPKLTKSGALPLESQWSRSVGRVSGSSSRRRAEAGRSR